MSDKDIKNLMELAESKIRNGVTREEAMESLIAVGILQPDGEYTEIYRNLLREAGLEA